MAAVSELAVTTDMDTVAPATMAATGMAADGIAVGAVAAGNTRHRGAFEPPFRLSLRRVRPVDYRATSFTCRSRNRYYRNGLRRGGTNYLKMHRGNNL